METSNISTERAGRVGEKSNNKERKIVVQFSFYKEKLNILRNCKKLKGTNNSIVKDFSKKAMQIYKEKQKEVLTNRKLGKIAKCAKIVFQKGKMIKGKRLAVLKVRIGALDQNKNDFYRFLGCEQADKIGVK